MNRTDSDERRQSDEPNHDSAEQGPFVAKLVESTDAGDAHNPDNAPIRIGSPFRQDPTDLPPPDQVTDDVAVAYRHSGEAAYGEFGPFLYTAMGASAAAVVVLAFSAAGAWWFPAGGAAVAMLGTTLSIIGLFSTRRYRYAAIAMLPLHMGLFFVSYARSLS